VTLALAPPAARSSLFLPKARSCSKPLQDIEGRVTNVWLRCRCYT
jgi:hypothetical protein